MNTETVAIFVTCSVVRVLSEMWGILSLAHIYLGKRVLKFQPQRLTFYACSDKLQFGHNVSFLFIILF